MRDYEIGGDWEKEKLTEEWLQAQSSKQFNVVRRVYQQETLNKDANYSKPHRPWRFRLKKLLRRYGFNDCIANSVPICKWLRKYDVKNYLLSDIIAGGTTAIMHIPQGMGYALLAGATPITGLYMAFFPIFMYVIFGTSPHVSMGTFAVACLMAGKVVHEYTTDTENSPAMYTPQEVLAALSFLVGMFQIVMWILRLGVVSTLLSEPLVSGFTTGAAFNVGASQLKDLFGIKLPRLPSNYKVIYTVKGIIDNITSANTTACIISSITCIALTLNNEFLKPWVGKRSRLPVPAELIAIVSGTLLSRYLMFHDNYGINLVGSIPTGLPPPTLPPFSLMSEILMDAFAQTMVTYTISLSLGFIFASKEKYEVDPNQELLAMGASNVFGSFFVCAPICASLSRSFIQYTAGCKTLITSLVSAALVLLVLLWIGPFFEMLPRCVLASIVVVSLKGLFMQIGELRKFWKLSKLDAIVWLVTFLVTLTVNIDYGLGAGLLASVCALFCRSQRPYTCMLGRVMDTDLYLDIKRYRAAQELPGVKIFHYCGGLNFATKNQFRLTLLYKIGYLRPTVLIHNQHADDTTSNYELNPNISNTVKCVIIDATALSYVDAPGIKALLAVEQTLASANIINLLAGANGPMQEMIEKYNSLEKESLVIPMFPTVHDAVMYYFSTVSGLEKDDAAPVSVKTT